MPLAATPISNLESLYRFTPGWRTIVYWVWHYYRYWLPQRRFWLQGLHHENKIRQEFYMYCLFQMQRLRTQWQPGPECLWLWVLIYKESFFRVWGLPKIVGSSFRLIISFATNCVTIGIKDLKLCFTSEFELSRGVDFECFRKVSHLVTSPEPLLVTSQHAVEEVTVTKTGPTTCFVHPDIY